MINKVNILLVDDSERILAHLKELLSDLDEVAIAGTASTLPEAQKIVKNLPVDVIILDIQLPDGNGIDFLKWVKFVYPRIKVIMLSNLADDCHRAAARFAGAEYFFDKSIEFDKVNHAVAELAGKFIS